MNNIEEKIINCYSNIKIYNELMNIFKNLNIDEDTINLKNLLTLHNLPKNINYTNILKKELELDELRNLNINEYDLNTILVYSIINCKDLDKYIKDILSVTISEYFKYTPILIINGKRLNISKHFCDKQIMEKNKKIIITKNINFLQWFLLNISPLHFLNSDFNFNHGIEKVMKKGFLFYKLLNKYLKNGRINIYESIKYNILYQEIDNGAVEYMFLTII